MLKTRTMAVIAALSMAATVPFQASGQSQSSNVSAASQAGFDVIKRNVNAVGTWARAPYEPFPTPRYEFQTAIGGAAGSYILTQRLVLGWKGDAGGCRYSSGTIAAQIVGNVLTQDHAQTYDGRRGWSGGNGTYDHDRRRQLPVTIVNSTKVKLENQTLVLSMRRDSMSMRLSNLEDRLKNEIERTLQRRFNSAPDLRITLSASEAAHYRSQPAQFMRGFTRLDECVRQ